MKKVKIFLAAGVLVLSTAAVFAFKSNAKPGEGTLFHKVNSVCVLDNKCAQGGTTNACPAGPHFSDDLCTITVSDTEIVPQ